VNLHTNAENNIVTEAKMSTGNTSIADNQVASSTFVPPLPPSAQQQQLAILEASCPKPADITVTETTTNNVIGEKSVLSPEKVSDGNEEEFNSISNIPIDEEIPTREVYRSSQTNVIVLGEAELA